MGMRAIGVRGRGGPEMLAGIEVERPEPGPTEVLVRVRAAGVNPVDWQIRESGGFDGWDAPAILGFDVSGTVEAVGLGVTVHRPGDEVFGMLPFPRRAGGYAEYAAAPARCFVRKPAAVDHTGAAALPLAAVTAWQALVDTAGLCAGRTVLVHAAAGGVGHLAVQLAKARGARVVGTARAENHPFLRTLGADELIDYRRIDFARAVRDVDVVVDAVGGDYGRRSLDVLRPGGHLVSLAAEEDDVPVEEARERGVHAGLMLVEPDNAALRAVARLVEAGRLRAEIDRVLPLAEAREAHAYGERGRTRGKIVLTVVP